jgi:SAM-dependent methyltransferase
MDAASIRFDLTPRAAADFEHLVRTLGSGARGRRVLDVGGGANPFLSLEFVREHGIDYTVLDISSEELGKAPGGYKTIVGDIAGSAALPGKYDLIFSRMLAEHVVDGEAFHRNVYQLLATGGIAVHYFPTLYALPFLINRWFPERLGYWLLEVLQPGLRKQEGRKAKFPAFYSWCRGPTASQIARLERLGYRVEQYLGFFGHGGYYRRFKPMFLLNQWLSKMLVDHPVAALTSFAVVVLRRD